MHDEMGNEVVELRQERYDVPEPDAVVLCDRPFYQYNVENPYIHHCMMALTRAEDSDWLKLPENFNGDEELVYFLTWHPEIAQNNIVIENKRLKQHTEIVALANFNDIDENYIINFDLGDSNFGNCNIGEIQILCTYMDCPFDIRIRPEKDQSETSSGVFRLPAKFDGSITITYFVDNPGRKCAA
jgi:hypothetical protein